MKQCWTKSELEEEWTLSPYDIKCLGKKTGANKLAFALKLKHFQFSHRFPKTPHEIPFAILHHMARQLGIMSEVILQYEWKSRVAREHDTQIRKILGVKTLSRSDANNLLHWLTTVVIPQGFRRDQLIEMAQTYFREMHIEPFGEQQLDRYIGSALRQYEDSLFEHVLSKLSEETKIRLDNLLVAPPILIRKRETLRFVSSKAV